MAHVDLEVCVVDYDQGFLLWGLKKKSRILKTVVCVT